MQPQVTVVYANQPSVMNPTNVALQPTAHIGLAVLDQIPGLLVRQSSHFLDDVVGLYEKANRYQIFARPPNMPTEGNDEMIKNLPKLWKAKEESECCERHFCGPWRSFIMHIDDALGQEVLRFERPFLCTCFWSGCLLINPQRIDARLSDGSLCGSVVQHNKCCDFSKWFQAFDGNGQLLYELRASCLQCPPNCCCPRWTCDILLPDGQVAGSINNLWPGCNCRSMFSKADNLEIIFERPMPATHKVVLLAGLFLIDFMYFEEPADKGNY
eukprot:CAMPEP_0114549382 /NCGR_PEP_ID=MMETSP0114-20121206/5498_1 /TAXON_ID=31324 /ORGANISM="Goniomonas sp, Strain m" /LENGTH=269 /DNA_ID=CAMNT_0001734061 /DNA_START=18 /DNA_END=827 /DNA_ORIENTATION=+